ncbi:hypothetical protein MATL_G00219150 [Megalops atlanticus]|uniref:non-specific serine/threonine protein kinase n=1 Tax=Megalops atlanticus TaxID=7932 RepID=A0A9D3T3W7_MEGAT|nr:hypothetical protein MATL_G00219150 [Megalops atlanticus]
MSATICVMVMSSSFFNPSLAFSSHFDSDGAPLSELSWSSSLAVVAVSFSGLFTFIFLMLACLCCKKGDIGFKPAGLPFPEPARLHRSAGILGGTQVPPPHPSPALPCTVPRGQEFENTEGEEYQADASALASPSSQSGHEVYVLPLTQVSLPVSKQPGRSVQLLKSADLGRHSLLYLKEIGHGWFGKVLLGEVNAGLSSIQVVVKELKASASVQEQMQFLEEVQPYRALQHPTLLQCLAQCSEVTPYLLVMEFCPLGDLKGYLCSCRAADSMTPDPLILQRMACEIASGLLHLHKHNFIHSDLALRNCLLTAEVTVKIGDYGLSHNKYKDDYFVTPDQLWVPLRWIAPELIDEVHGNLLVADQTKTSNVWSLGVTIWELFELGNQPYRHYSDRQVLTYAVKEQQLKLPKPQLKVPLLERWYEVMQFCWLQPDQRPNVEEVHLLLTYLCAKGSSEPEEDFESRWNSLRPGMGLGASAAEPASSSSSSFPLLERFATGDGFHGEAGDDVLTVTETSHGLSFEYKWEESGPERPFHTASTSGPLGQGNPHYQDIYYPPEAVCGGKGLTLGVSPSCYEPKPLHTPGVVPVLSAHSPSVSSEYYIRIEEPVEGAVHLDRSPSSEGGDEGDDYIAGSGRSGPEAPPDSYWSADAHRAAAAYDSDLSPAVSLTLEPLLGQVSGASGSPVGPWESGQCFSYEERGGFYYERSPSPGKSRPVAEETRPEDLRYSWDARSPPRAQGEPESPLGTSPSLSSPSPGHHDPHLDGGCEPVASQTAASEHCCTAASPSPRSTDEPCSVSIEIEPEDSILTPRQDSDAVYEGGSSLEREARSWASNHSANNNSSTFGWGPAGGTQETYADFHHATTSSTDTWPEVRDTQASPTCYTYRPDTDTEAAANRSGFMSLHKPHPLNIECSAYIHMCREGDSKLHLTAESPPCTDPLSGALVRSFKVTEVPRTEEEENSLILTGVVVPKVNAEQGTESADHVEQRTNVATSVVFHEKEGAESQEVEVSEVSATLLGKRLPHPATSFEPVSDSGVGTSYSSFSVVDVGDCSDDDVTDAGSGVFADLPVECVEGPPFMLLQEQVGMPDSVDSVAVTSAASSCKAFSPASFHPSTQPKALDSGYDTENNESPEFIPKEPPEPRDPNSLAPPPGKLPFKKGSELDGSEAAVVLQVEVDGGPDAHSHAKLELSGFSSKNPYRDSAYFSDYDAENERFPQDEEEGDIRKSLEEDGEQGDLAESAQREELNPPHLDSEEGDRFTDPEESKNIFEIDMEKTSPVVAQSEPEQSDSSSGPVLSTLSPSPPEMGGCLTKESSQDEGLGLDPDHSGEEPSSECSSSSSASSSSSSAAVSQSLSMPQESPAAGERARKGAEARPGSRKPTAGDRGAEEEAEGRGEGSERGHELRDGVRKGEEEEDSPGTSNEGQEALPEGADFPSPSPPSSSSSSSSSPPNLLPPEARAPLGEGEEADWEDRDSEDSEESDEELRSYSVQEQSEESEEESHPVPVVVSDRSGMRHLRSLLKMPTLLTESFCHDLEHKKKAVSFFDDVTVYLFDQESPTQELAEHGFPPGVESSGPSTEGRGTSAQDRVSTSDDSSDGNISEESGGFEWDDDFPLMPGPSSMLPDSPTLQAPEAPPCLPPWHRPRRLPASVSHASPSRTCLTPTWTLQEGAVKTGRESNRRKNSQPALPVSQKRPLVALFHCNP